MSIYNFLILLDGSIHSQKFYPLAAILFLNFNRDKQKDHICHIWNSMIFLYLL